MSKKTGVFGFEMGSGGVSIYAIRDSVTNAAMTDAELDTQIKLAKADMDSAGKRAKVALKKYLSKPLVGIK